MVNYNQSKIYKIVSNCGNLIYIGSSTKKYLSTRLAQHKSNYKLYKNGNKNYTTSYQLFDAYEPENCEIILLENINCESKNELHARERYYIESLDCVNKFIPCRTYKEYYEDNREKILEHQKEYKQQNKEKIQQQQNEKFTCICGSRYTYTHKLRHLKTLLHINYIKTLDPIPDLQESAII